jgi:phospholipid/cholesterol/gamma-HCH transport system substrate-binding protein
MRRNIIETVVAGVVLLVAGFFLVFALDRTRPPSFEGYELTARFADAPTLEAGAEVRIAGVTVGRVTKVSLDMQRYEVDVALLVRDDLKLASDSRLVMTFDGLMGGGILVLKPGRGGETLKPGDRIRNTESPVNVVDQFGRFLYGDSGGQGDDF